MVDWYQFSYCAAAGDFCCVVGLMEKFQWFIQIGCWYELVDAVGNVQQLDVAFVGAVCGFGLCFYDDISVGQRLMTLTGTPAFPFASISELEF